MVAVVAVVRHEEDAQPVEVDARDEGEDSPDEAPHEVGIHPGRLHLRRVRRPRLVRRGSGARRAGRAEWRRRRPRLFVQTRLLAMGVAGRSLVGRVGFGVRARTQQEWPVRIAALVEHSAAARVRLTGRLRLDEVVVAAVRLVGAWLAEL